MNTVDAIAEILVREGVEFLSCFPTTPVIESAAQAGIRPIICRQERVGVGIADGFSRTTNGKRMGVFAMQYGPGPKTPTQAWPPRTPTQPLCWYCRWDIRGNGREFCRTSAP